MRYVVCYIVLMIAISGCVSIPNIPTPDPFTLPDVGDKALPEPFVDDFSESMVRVVVPFTILGPKMEKALASTLTPAENQCRTFGREAELASGMFRKWGTNGHYIFLFSCVESREVADKTERIR